MADKLVWIARHKKKTWITADQCQISCSFPFYRVSRYFVRAIADATIKAGPGQISTLKHRKWHSQMQQLKQGGCQLWNTLQWHSQMQQLKQGGYQLWNTENLHVMLWYLPTRLLGAELMSSWVLHPTMQFGNKELVNKCNGRRQQNDTVYHYQTWNKWDTYSKLLIVSHVS